MKDEVYLLGRLGGFMAQFSKVLACLKNNPLGQPWPKRANLFFLYLKFTAKDLFLTRFLKKKIESETFLNYRVHFSGYSSFRNLFIELFILQQYYFKTEEKEPHIIDCGANIGMSVIFFKFLYPDSHILAFEPDEDSFSLLKANIEHNNLGNVTMRNVALSDHKGDIAFYINTSNNSVSTAVGAIFKKEELVIKKVQSEILSEFIHQEIDLLKIDVEGFEDVIIQELAGKDALRLVKNMAVEYHPYLCRKMKAVEDLLKFLKDSQFDCIVKSYQKNYLIYAQK